MMRMGFVELIVVIITLGITCILPAIAVVVAIKLIRKDREKKETGVDSLPPADSSGDLT